MENLAPILISVVFGSGLLYAITTSYKDDYALSEQATHYEDIQKSLVGIRNTLLAVVLENGLKTDVLH